MPKFVLPVAAALAITGAALAATPPPNVVISNCGKFVEHPKSLVVTCADANYRLASLKWGSWGGKGSSGTGIAKVNDCKPNCAAGHFKSYRVAVAADRAVKCGKQWRYLRLTIVYEKAHPRGIRKTDVHKLSCAR